VAPYEVVIIPANQEEETQAQSAERLYHQLLERRVEVVLDDRDERAGAKFKDADLIGYPLRVVCGRGVAKGQVEIKWRWESQGREIPLSDAGTIIPALIEEERAKYL
jgi:prolyl-tRNA synthetase